MNSKLFTRKGIFLLLGVAAALLAIAVLVETPPAEDQLAEAQTTERPNFVFVMTDDLDERSMGNLGGIREVMGSNGVTFNNAYVTYSLCCPSRATFLRGQYPHNHQIIGNDVPTGGAGKFRSLGLDQSTIATWLNKADYQTKYIGKYMNAYGGTYVPPGWDEWFVFMNDPAQGRINQDGQEIALSGHSTDVFAGRADDFIRRSSAPDNPDPFFVVIGTKAPHSPPEIATRYQDTFATTPLPTPPNFNEKDMSDKPKYMRSFGEISPEGMATMQNEYRKRLRSMLSVEDLLRRIVATLQETGELNNTFIIFTSDNGYHFGNHRFWMNKRTPYEEDIGVPLMVRGPGVPAGAVRQQLVINNDLAPTIAELAGANIPAFVDGRSFAPLLTTTPPSSWRQAFLEEGWLEGGTVVPTPTHKGVHTQDRMFVEYDTGERELYDLALDPYQLQSKPQVGNEQLYSELGARLNNLRDCAGDACRAAEWTAASPPPGCTITGTANAETISGTSGDDVICAGDGNDTINGLAGNDILKGERGADKHLGGVGNDTLDGGTGTDTASYSPSLTAVVASLATNSATGEGSDTFTSIENLLGSSKADTLTGSGTNNTLTGGGSTDTESGGAGTDTVIGSGGADTLKGEDGNDTVNSQDGVSGNDTLDGGAGTDTKVTDATENSIVNFP